MEATATQARETINTWYLEMTRPDQLIPKAADNPDFVIQESLVKQYSFNRFLYALVGKNWQWTDKLSWSDTQWQEYAENDNLRLWVAWYQGSPAGYFELQNVQGDVEIAYFGLAEPFIGKGLGGSLLSTAIEKAWAWNAQRVWVHTCSLDHAHALKNYQARGFQVYKEDCA